MDRLTVQKLVDTNQYNNPTLTQKIDSVEALERTLDVPPQKYAPTPFDTEKLTPFGIYRDYRTRYRMLYEQFEPHDAEIVIGKEVVTCPYRVLIALKTITVCGICKSAQRANACREVFGLVISRREHGELSAEMIQPALRDTGDYYRNEIIRAIIDSVYTQREQITLQIKEAMKLKYEESMVSLFYNTDDVDMFEEEVSSIYKTACLDPDFRVFKSKGKVYNAVLYKQHLTEG